jgi:hypothetical protein
MTSFTKQFDEHFNQVDHYKRFPAMRPYVGCNYGENGNRKIMLIAESHYLPPTSTINKSADVWYNSTQSDLTKEEVEWIHTRNLVNCDWKSDGHMIFRELNLRLSEFFDNSDSRAMTNVVYMNGFQRPSPETGSSIKHFCTQQDYDISAKTIKEVIRIVNPDLVLFVSKTSWDKLRWKLPKENNCRKYDFVCHPGTGGRYWHNKNYGHGVKKFQQLLAEV